MKAMNFKRWIGIVFIFSLLITGCAQQDNDPQTSANGLQYEIGSHEWPSLVETADARVREAYQFAVAHPEVLNFMPCYCGCYEGAGHESNTDCFVESVNGGIAVLDDMGLG